MRWFKRFGLHLAAAVGATGVFVAAAAVGANQARPSVTPVPTVLADRTRTPRPRPQVTATPQVSPERSLAGRVLDVQADAIEVQGVGGREWRVVPAPGALIRLNGKAAPLQGLQAGDTVVILGQAQLVRGQGPTFLAHAITARRR